MEKKSSTTRTRHDAGTPAGGARPAARKPRATKRIDASDAPAPTHEQIALRAHELYLRSGCQPGRELEFWLEAERQLKDETSAVGV